MPDVSVVIPLYGEHRARDSLLTVTTAWLAQDVPCEVVVATAGDIPVNVAEDLDADRRVRVVRAPAEARAPGLLRNAGAAQARSPLLYLTDADVAPLGRDYLARALVMAEGRALAQPWMHRIPSSAAGPAAERAVDCTTTGPGLFCFVTASPGGALHAYEGEELIWKRPSRGAVRHETPRVLPPAAQRDAHAPRSLQWRAPYHWGGLLLQQRTFTEVGGYCPRYAGWGSEDDDLLVKVAARTSVLRGWQADRSWRCLHFEHPVPATVTPDRRSNEALYAERLAAGPEAMIVQDRAGADD
ncbi:galactosyltransferase-related protein [Streptomyces sp. BP-8]|uniref:Glycosyltransferase family 2 protein n=1 Tax=Streptomyces sirii TaxID=3127701 RepID=A0ABZ2QHI5_9ACTN